MRVSIDISQCHSFIQNLISTEEDLVLKGIRLTNWLLKRSVAAKVK